MSSWPGMRRDRIVTLLAVGVVLSAVSAAADDMDDALKAVRAEFKALKQDEYEEIFGARQAKLGQLPFRDQAYGVAKALSTESGWDAPEKLYVFQPSTAAGTVYACTWTPGKKGEGAVAVTLVVTRYNHAAGKSRVGKADVSLADPFALVQALSRAWSAGLDSPPAPETPPAPGGDAPPPAQGTPPSTDPAAKQAVADREACVEAVKKSVGVGRVYAAVQGRPTATGKRERREWWAWTGSDAKWIEGAGDATWVACARYEESALSKSNAALSKGGYFMSKVHLYKGVAAK